MKRPGGFGRDGVPPRPDGGDGGRRDPEAVDGTEPSSGDPARSDGPEAGADAAVSPTPADRARGVVSGAGALLHGRFGGGAGRRGPDPAEPESGRPGAHADVADNETVPIEPLRESRRRRAWPSPRARREPRAGREPRARRPGSVERSARRREAGRFRAGFRRRRRAWLVPVVAVVALAAVSVVVTFTPIFAVRQVQVDGAARIDGSAVADALGTQLGRPFPLVDEAEVKAALVRFPLIETYQLESRPPSTLVVRLIERTPIGVVEAADGFDVVDGAGVVIERRGERPDDMPLLDVDAPAGAGFEAAAAVMRALPAPLLAEVGSVAATSIDDVSFELRDSGKRVTWGSTEASVRKARVLEALRENYPDAEGYDVSSPDVPLIT